MKRTAIQKFIPQAHPSQAALEALIALRLYSAGQSDSAAASGALRRLEYIYGHPIKSAVALFRRGFALDDTMAQQAVRYEALSHIIDWIFHDQIEASFWEAGLNIARALKDIGPRCASYLTESLKKNPGNCYPV